MVLAGGKHRGQAVVGELGRLFPGTSMIGGSVAGTASRQEVSYGGFEVAVVAFMSNSVTPEIFSSPETPCNDGKKARDLGRRIRENSEEGSSLLFFYDSVASGYPRRLHHGSSIAAGLHSGLRPREMVCAGAGLLTDFNFDSSWIADASGVRQHAIAAMVFPPALGMQCSILPGSRSVGVSFEITKIDGADIYELDGRPAYQTLCDALGRDAGASDKVLALNVSLGQAEQANEMMDRSRPMVNRLILSENKHNQSVTLFEPDFVKGEEVQILLQDIDFMQESVRKGVAAQIDAIRGRDTALSVYLDCAGRCNLLTGSSDEDSAIMMREIPAHWPCIGLYSGIEVCHVDDQLRALDLTGVLATVYFK